MSCICAKLRMHMQAGRTVVLEVANPQQQGQVTTLAWDIAHEGSQVLHFEGEVIVCWDKYGYGHDHSSINGFMVHARDALAIPTRSGFSWADAAFCVKVARTAAKHLWKVEQIACLLI